MVEQELISVAVATAAAVVGLNKGLAYLIERRNNSNGNLARYATFRDVDRLRIEWTTMCNERHRTAEAQRVETHADNVASRATVKTDSLELHSEIGQFRLEILELGKKVDRVVDFLSKKTI